MAEIINLRMARKARLRHKAADSAAHNRARHGRTGEQRRADAAQADRAARHLAGHELEKPAISITNQDETDAHD